MLWLKLIVHLIAQTIEYNSLNYCLNVLKLLASVDSKRSIPRHVMHQPLRFVSVRFAEVVCHVNMQDRVSAGPFKLV